MASLTLKNVCKSYDDVEVIRDVTVSVPRGTFLVLVGPSGCGKSTLLRMIAGLEPVTGGEISINDRVVNDVPPKERDVAMVFQSYALYPHLSVSENMAFSLRMRRAGRQEIDEKVGRAAELLGLSDYLDRLPRQLSGGQCQRVAMGRAIVRNPAIFLFDEPLSNLDAKLRGQMRTELRELHREIGNTTVYVTHDQLEAMTMADRILVLNEGRTEQIGEPMELYDRPANLFVAQFIGTQGMNIFEGRIDGNCFVSGANGRIPLPAWAGRHSGREVTLGIRPKHFEFVDDGGEGIGATVAGAEITGAEVFLDLRFGGHTFNASYRDPLPGDAGSSMSRSSARFRRGDRIHVAPRRIHLFDAATGNRI